MQPSGEGKKNKMLWGGFYFSLNVEVTDLDHEVQISDV